MSEPVTKKVKLSEANVVPADVTNVVLLKQSDGLVVYTGKFGEEGTSDALLMLSKSPLNATTAADQVKNSKNDTEETFRNSKYSKYTVTISDTWRAELIAPCTTRDVLKYSPQTFYVVRETPAIYKAVTLPFIEAIPAKAIQWVYNILEGTAEVENVLEKHDDFLIVKDYKWNDESDELAMHLLGLVLERGTLRSVRDLRGKHVTLLKNIVAAGLKVLQDKFKIDKSQVRVYFHYHPTFFHLHVHFDHISARISGATHSAGKAILVEDVIFNLELDGDYYEKADITFVAGSLRDVAILEKLTELNIVTPTPVLSTAPSV
eukprot:m.74879 g.74879  ORF g.74879 m.74879 type:complete len:319 (-) comp24708_c0_seq1:44-1000(-)